MQNTAVNPAQNLQKQQKPQNPSQHQPQPRQPQNLHQSQPHPHPQNLIDTTNPAFAKAVKLMRWGAAIMPICAAGIFVSMAISQALLFAVFAGYLAGVFCYMFGSYLFSKLCASRLFWLNIIRFCAIIAFSAFVGAFGAMGNIFGAFLIVVVCGAFGVFFAIIERRVAIELTRKTGIRYFRLAFRFRVFAYVALVMICAFLALGIAIGLDLQAVLTMMNTADGLSLFVQDNPAVFVLYCIVAIGINVSIFASLFLYIMAYFRVVYAYKSSAESKACKGACGCVH